MSGLGLKYKIHLGPKGLYYLDGPLTEGANRNLLFSTLEDAKGFCQTRENDRLYTAVPITGTLEHRPEIVAMHIGCVTEDNVDPIPYTLVFEDGPDDSGSASYLVELEGQMLSIELDYE